MTKQKPSPRSRNHSSESAVNALLKVIERFQKRATSLIKKNGPLPPTELVKKLLGRKQDQASWKFATETLNLLLMLGVLRTDKNMRLTLPPPRKTKKR